MKMSLTACPSSDRLREFVEGEIDEALVDDILRHLDVCAECRRKIENEPYQEAWAREIKTLASEQAQAPVDVTVPLARLNELLPDYEILSEIGRGGMGIVYRARQRKLNRDVALKVLPALLAAFRPDARARFQREAELAARLKHTSIIAIHDYGEVDGTLYYAMELVEGRSLRELIEELRTTRIGRALTSGKRRSSDSAGYSSSNGLTAMDDSVSLFMGSSRGSPPSDAVLRRAYYERVASWIADVAEGLAFAHGHGVIHRDVKPSNLLLTRDNRVMISDFGLARSSAMETITVGASLLGTARYMSPEQIDGTRGSIDHRVDVYALGATLYELLTLRPLFETTDDHKVLHHVLNDEPTPPRRVLASVPAELETICLKALEKDPEVRYPTAQAFADDLRRWLLGMPILARGATWMTRARKFVRRRKLSVSLTAASILLLATSGLSYRAYRASRLDAQTAKTRVLAQEIELLRREGEEKRDEGKLKEALQRADVGLQMDPDSEDLVRLKTSSLLLLQRVPEAVATLDQFLARKPESLIAHFLLARIMGPRGHFGDSVAYEQPQAQLSLSLEERTGLFRFHREQVARLAQVSKQYFFLMADDEPDPEKAVKLLSRALDLEPNWFDALDARITRYEQLHDYESMLLDAERQTAAFPGWATGYFAKGRALSGLGRLQEAEGAYSEAIRRNSDNAGYWNNRAAVKYRQGRYAEALADANEAIRQDSSQPYFYGVRAQALAGMGQLKESMADFDRAIRIDPTRKQVYFARAGIQRALGHFEDMANDMTRVIELDPRDANALRVRAQAYNALKLHPRAIADLNAAVRMSPAEPDSYRERRLAYYRAGQLDDALADCTKAIELQPGKPDDYQARLILSLLKKDYNAAVGDITKLMDLQPDARAMYRMYRGMAYELASATALADAEYQKVAAMDGAVRDYATLWRYILLHTNNQPAQAQHLLAAHPAPAENQVWTERLFAFYSDKIKARELLNAAVTDAERCEADYYIGMKDIIEGRTEKGRQSLEACVNSNQEDVMEHLFARTRLAQLN